MIKASYRRPELREHCGNPLIEALPPIQSTEETLETLSRFPDFDVQQRSHPVHLRLHYLDRILDIVQAQPEHAMLATRISRLIRHGYKSRNPLSPDHLRHGYSLATQVGFEGQRAPVGFAKCRSAAYVTGLSGIGKSTSVERALSAYPQVITHERYRDVPFTQTQVVWLKIECPHDGSAKQLCLSVLEALDKALEGTDYFEQHSRRRSGVEHLISAMARLIHNFHVGLLVIDEIQNLTCSPLGGETKVLNLLVSLVNKLGVPQLDVGTFESARLFSKTFRNARRVSWAGPIVLDRYAASDPRWQLFVEALWHYQWVQKPVKLTENFVAALYEASQGVTDVAVNIFMILQENAIVSGIETFGCQDVAKLVPTCLGILQPALEALRRGDRKTYEQFRELLPPADQWKESLSALDDRNDLNVMINQLVAQREKRLNACPPANPPESVTHGTETGAIQDSNCCKRDAQLSDGIASVRAKSPLPDLEKRVLKARQSRQ